MHVAVGGCALEVAKILLSVANLDAVAMGDTPLDVAKKRRDSPMITLLSSSQ